MAQQTTVLRRAALYEREQRRYEIARDVVAAMPWHISDMYPEDIRMRMARRAVAVADAVLAALDEQEPHP